jgi:putative membrane protein insertion efficiency factor
MTEADGTLALARPSAAARVLVVLITGYRRFVSPLMAPRCRFEPSCSAYALEAIREHGALRGAWLAVRRVGRCHPFHPGGYDPVPPATPYGHLSRPEGASS